MSPEPILNMHVIWGMCCISSGIKNNVYIDHNTEMLLYEDKLIQFN